MSTMSKNYLSLLAIWIFLIGLVGGAQAQTNISNSPGWFSSCPRLTVDPAGNVHAIWAEFYTLSGPYATSGDAFYSKYNITTKQWSSPLNLSNSRQCFSGEWLVVGIDSDPSGNVYVVYVDSNKVKLRILSGGSWSAPFEVGSNPGSEADSARIAVDAQSNIFICWYQPYGSVYSRARIGGAWENVATISRPGTYCKFPEISVGANSVYCVFQDNHSNPSQYNAVYVCRAKAFGANWSSSQRLTSSAETEEHPAVKVDANDVAHVVYTPYFGGPRIVRYVEGTSSGFSAPIDLGGLGGDHYPALYVQGTNIYTCWQSWGIHYHNRIDGVWKGENAVPNSSCYAHTDVATSPTQDKVYYIADNSSGDIYFYELAGPGPFEAPSTAYVYATADIDADGHDEIVVDLDALGLWVWDNGVYYILNYNNPEFVIRAEVDRDGRDEIVGDFGNLGLWIWDNGVWTQMSSKNPEFLVAVDTNGNGLGEIAADFGSQGVQIWESGTWYHLNYNNPEFMIRVDIDMDWRDEIVGDFGSLGLWLYNNGVWNLLCYSNPESIGCGDTDGDGLDEIVGDFGTIGLWLWDNGTWTRLNYNNPRCIIIADTDEDGRDEIVGDFGGLGFWIWDNGAWGRVALY